MKTRILLTTLGVAALTAITFNTNGALLSPRAAGNQIKIVSGTANDPNLVAVDQGLALPPRATGNAIATTAGTNGSVNPTVACAKTMAGSPKDDPSLCRTSGNDAGLRQNGRHRQVIGPCHPPGCPGMIERCMMRAADENLRRPLNR